MPSRRSLWHYVLIDNPGSLRTLAAGRCSAASQARARAQAASPGKLRLQGIVLLWRFPYSRDMARTLGETRRKRREAMRRYRTQLRPQYQPLAPTEIRQLRERLGLSQRAFAARVGVYMGTIIRWEKDRANPRFLATERLQELQRELEEP